MANRATIEKVKKELNFGDQAEISRRTGLSKVTVNHFFNKKEGDMAAETHNKIMSAALEIIGERQKQDKAVEKKTSSLLD